MILALFSEDAVTVLGIYYKIQSFFFIPLLGFQQVLLPVISYNFGAGQTQRIQQTVRVATMLSTGLMFTASLVFLLFPQPLLTIFSGKKELLQIGEYAFRVISLNFVPAVITIVVTSHLQGIAKMKLSVFVIVLRQVVLLVEFYEIQLLSVIGDADLPSTENNLLHIRHYVPLLLLPFSHAFADIFPP